MKIVIAAIAAIVALKTAAIAQPTAEDLFAEGQTAYDKADYAVAIARWRASYDLSGEHGLLFNLAQAMRLSGDCANAVATYRKFAALDPTADQRQLAEDLARELEPTCRSRTPDPAPPPPDPVGGLNLGHGLNDSKLDETRPGRSLRIAGLVTVGAGAVTLATGLAFGYRARSLGDEVTDACRTSCDWSVQKSKHDAGRRYTTVGRALDVVGVAAIAGGAVMYYLGSRESSVTVSPRSREGGAVVSWSGSW